MFAGFCPNCGAPMKVEFLGVCPYCGYDVVDDEMGEYKVCSVCGEYVEKEITGEFPVYCPVCGNQLDEDSRTYSHAGTTKSPYVSTSINTESLKEDSMPDVKLDPADKIYMVLIITIGLSLLGLFIYETDGLGLSALVLLFAIASKSTVKAGFNLTHLAG